MTRMARTRALIVARLGGAAALAALTGATWATDARANVPPYLTEQGRLFDASGNPITAAVTMEFNLYAAATGGTSLWTEKQTITPESGYFSAELGSETAFPAGVFANAAASGQNLFLGVTVSSDAEIAPRQPLQSVPYALVADNAIGNITPATVSVGGTEVINGKGQWVGSSSGLVGPTGAAGPAGSSGAQGAQGSQGAQGTAGDRGATGPQGSQGAAGAQGSQGAAGAQGPQGDKGATGAQGAQGAAGGQGAAGAQGPTGAQGAPGSQGAQGSQGPQGPQGSSGLVSCEEIYDVGSGTNASTTSCPSGWWLTGGGCGCNGNVAVAVSSPVGAPGYAWSCICASSVSAIYMWALCCH